MICKLYSSNIVATMFIDSCTSKVGGRTYTRYLLRENYRQGGKVKHRTIANLSRCSEAEISAIRLALRHKDDLSQLGSVRESVTLEQGQSVGAVWLIYDLARQLGIADALGSSRQGKLALWQVIARAVDHGSWLSAVRLAGGHAACDILELDSFNEEDLYKNLDWLAEKQGEIERSLFRKLHRGKPPWLYLYDVTSTYLEGVRNELSAFGYNRDGKKGKRQIVIGLLCNESGQPLSIEVFAGNLQDPKTVASQVNKAAERFGGGEVVFVGDRGMIKSKQVDDLVAHGFHYITAITKPEIEVLLRSGVMEMSLFDQELAEVTTEEGQRYILRRNPVRVGEIEAGRQEKLIALRRQVDKCNVYLAEHPRAQVEVWLRKVTERCDRLKLSRWVSMSATGRRIAISVDEASLAEVARLDGCYVLKTDLGKEVVDKETIHARYKDLALVEWAFRTSKTVELEIRPVHVHKARRTRGHAFVVMLAYRIVQELARRWRHLEVTVEEGIKELASLCATKVVVKGVAQCNQIPEPRPSLRMYLEAARVKLPAALPSRGVIVATRKKLAERRKPR